MDLRQLRDEIYSSQAFALIGFLQTNFGEAAAAWFASSQFVGSGRWLAPAAGTIQHPTLVLTPGEYHHSLRMRLLLNTAVSNDAFPVPERCRCADHVPDAREILHVLDEGRPNNALYIRRHNAVRDVLKYVLRTRVEGVSMLESERVLDGQEAVGNAARLRADLVMRWGGADHAQHERIIDVTVANPAAFTYRNYHPHHVQNPPFSYYGCALWREGEKTAKYAAAG